MFKLFLVFILISTASLLCRASEGCNPVAQLAYIGTLHSQSVQFQPFYRQISFASAQINTINCREKKQLLKNNKYKEIQSLHASGDLVFVTVNQQGDSRCMLDLVNAKTLFTKSSVKTQDAVCSDKKMKKVSFNKGREFVYLSDEQFKLIEAKMEASK